MLEDNRCADKNLKTSNKIVPCTSIKNITDYILSDNNNYEFAKSHCVYCKYYEIHDEDYHCNNPIFTVPPDYDAVVVIASYLPVIEPSVKLRYWRK